MNHLIILAAVAALLGSAIVAGVFFAFSSLVMKAFARLPSLEGSPNPVAGSGLSSMG
jgi:uncharacterized membrane protein